MQPTVCLSPSWTLLRWTENSCTLLNPLISLIEPLYVPNNKKVGGGGETPAAADGAETGKTDMRKFNWIGMQRRRSGGWSQKYDLLLFFSILPYVTHPVSLFLLLCPSCQATVTLNQSNSHTVVKLLRWALRGRHYVLVVHCNLADNSCQPV